MESIPGLHKRLKIRARLHSLAELVPWNRFLGSLKVKKNRARIASQFLFFYQCQRRNLRVYRILCKYTYTPAFNPFIFIKN